MARRIRRTHGPAFKAKVALAAIKGEKTLVEFAQQYDVHANQITAWRAQLLEGAAGVFGVGTAGDDAAPAVDVKLLHASDKLRLRRDRRTGGGERFFVRCAQQGGPAERKAMIDRGHDLPLGRQAALLKLGRGSLPYAPRPVPAADLVIMRRIDALHLDDPFTGSRMLRDLLRGEGVAIGRDRVATMMRRMGICALYRRPNTSKPAPGHKIYPYLLRGLAVERPNQVGRSAASPWGHGHHLHSYGTRLHLLGGRGGLVQPAGPGVAAVDHVGGRVLLGSG